MNYINWNEEKKRSWRSEVQREQEEKLNNKPVENETLNSFHQENIYSCDLFFQLNRVKEVYEIEFVFLFIIVLFFSQESNKMCEYTHS